MKIIVRGSVMNIQAFCFIKTPSCQDTPSSHTLGGHGCPQNQSLQTQTATGSGVSRLFSGSFGSIGLSYDQGPVDLWMVRL